MEDLKTQLENLSDEDLLSLIREANSWDGYFDFADVYDIEELADTMDAYDLARAIIYGDVDNIIQQVRFNGYGNLETVYDVDLYSECRDYIDDLIDWLECNSGCIDLDCYGIEVA